MSLPQFHGCWQKTQDSWVRDKGQFITHSNSNSKSISIFTSSPISIEKGEEDQVIAAHTIGCITEKKPMLRELRSFLIDTKLAWPLPQQETLLCWRVSRLIVLQREYLYLPRLFTWKSSLGQMQLVPLLARCAEAKDLYGTVSPQAVAPPFLTAFLLSQKQVSIPCMHLKIYGQTCII